MSTVEDWNYELMEYEDWKQIQEGKEEKKMKRMVESYDELELFRDLLMDKFLRLCNCNDNNKLTLLKICAVVNACFDKSIETIQDVRKEDAGDVGKKEL